MPVLFVRREVNDASGLHLDRHFAFFADAAGAGDDVEDLAFGMGVPVCAGARLEQNASGASASAASRTFRHSRQS